MSIFTVWSLLILFTSHQRRVEDVMPKHHLLEESQYLLKIKSAQLFIFDPGRMSSREIYQYFS